MYVAKRRTQVSRLGVVAVAVLSIGCAAPAGAQEKTYGHGEDHAALLAELPKTRHSLADGIRQVSKPPETAISAKFELKGGKLMLSVYTAGKGLEHDAEHNVLKEYLGSPEGAKWTPETEVFEDVPHVARSAQYVALMRMASVSLLDVIGAAAKEGPVFSVKPKVEHGEGRFVVLVAKEGRALKVEYDLAGQLVEKYEEGKEKHGQNATSMNWTYDDVEAGKFPPGWKAEGTNQRGPVATWAVQADADAPSKPNVLVLTDAKEGAGGTFNLYWTDRVTFKDGVIEVKVKAGTGHVDQGGGPVWRVQDKNNYYIARWNPLEDNFRLYYVKDGDRKMLDSARVRADASKWHTVRIEHKGNEIRCYFDGEALLKDKDETLPAAGGVGLWTKADAVTAFDDLMVSAVDARSGE